MSLIHPDSYLKSLVDRTRTGRETLPPSDCVQPVRYSRSGEAAARDAVERELERLGVAPERLTADERLNIIASLEGQGLFLLKGAVRDAAMALQCSQASIYRYLSQLRSGPEETAAASSKE